MLGSGQLVRDSGVHPGKLKDDVTSPAGSTASGLWYLEQNCKYRIFVFLVSLQIVNSSIFNCQFHF